MTILDIVIGLGVLIIVLVIASAIEPDLRNAWELFRRKKDE